MGYYKYIQFVFLLSLLGLMNCNDPLTGDYYIPHEYEKYFINISNVNFEMIDQNGISEGYYVYEGLGYGLSTYQGDGFTIQDHVMTYISTMNGLEFQWRITALNGYGNPSLEVEWDWVNKIEYELNTKKITSNTSSKLKPQILLQDTITINHQVYNDIVIINIPEENLSDHPHVPFQTIVGGGIGPLQFSFTNGLVYTRK